MAQLLGALVIAILFRSVYYIPARTFYAQQDTKTPLYISFFSIGLNIVLAVWFTGSLDMGAYGLALAQSSMAVVEVLILFAVMNLRFGNILNREFWGAVWRMASATGFMAIISYVLVTLMPLRAGDESSFYFTFPKFVLIATISFAAYVAFSRMLKLREAEPIVARVRRVVSGGVRG